MSGDHTEITTTTGETGHAGPDAGHGSGAEVAHASAHGSEVGHHDADHERPEDWGWNRDMGKLARIAGYLSAIAILVLLIGNHHGRVEDIWLLVVAAIIFVILGRDAYRRRKSWRG